MSQIPFLDLKSQYQSLKSELDPEILEVMANAAFVGGAWVARFETSFAQYLGVPYTIGVGNGTEAIWIALMALGIGPGDEVIVPANTFIATAEAVSFCGAHPIFVDVRADDYLLDTDKLEDHITEDTAAIIPVHLYGQPADMSAIMDLAIAYDIPVIEDAAQAHGAKYRDRMAGSYGVFSTFSFYPGKNLGAYGDGGAIVTSNEGLVGQIRSFIDHGRDGAGGHKLLGFNSRLDGMQAAVLDVKLRHLDDWNRARQKNAALYNELFAASKIGDRVRTPMAHSDRTHVYHLYVIQADERDALRSYLAEQEIASGIHYKFAVPFSEAYADLGYTAEDLPVAHRLQSRILTLPMFPELTEEQIRRVVDTIEAFYLSR